MAEPYEPDNDELDLMACLGVIMEHCPSPKAKGTASGLLQARQAEIAGGET